MSRLVSFICPIRDWTSSKPQEIEMILRTSRMIFHIIQELEQDIGLSSREVFWSAVKFREGATIQKRPEKSAFSSEKLDNGIHGYRLSVVVFSIFGFSLAF
jgi:hypothetical protein